MTRRLRLLDRGVTLLLGLALLAAGLLLVDWHLHRPALLPARLDLSSAADVGTVAWWPVAALAGGLLLVVLALRWLVAHLPTGTRGDARLRDSSADGRILLDTGSIARAAAAALASDLTLPDVHGRVRAHRGRHLVELRARCTPGADVADLRERAEQVAEDVTRAFPSGAVSLRVLVEAPRRRRT